jgi:hypothetical protein
MRQGQQSRRGRNRGGRKPQNSISRNYESSGPDVKIRGTAMHIAEKYASLARDANSAGDTVAAENYLQHAEHYNRIILAAQAQNGGMGPDQQPNNMSGGNRFNPSEQFNNDQDDGDGEGDGDDFAPQQQLPRFLERPVYNQNQPQPFLPQNAFQHVQQQPAQQPAQPAAPVQNGAPFAGGENFPPAQEGPGRGRRRRRPIGERFNGRPGGGAGGAANGAAPAGAEPATDEAAS